MELENSHLKGLMQEEVWNILGLPDATADSLEKTWSWERLRWEEKGTTGWGGASFTTSMDRIWSNLQEIVEDRGPRDHMGNTVHEITKN